VDDRGRIGLAIGLGALVGGLAGYLLFTERGRELRDQLEPKLQDLLTEIDRLSTTFDRARAAAADGWRSFSQLMQEESRSTVETVKQTTPGRAH
jgi:gas vesicle protein